MAAPRPDGGTELGYSSQPQRLAVSLLYLGLLALGNLVLEGSPFPELDADGVWFYSGAAFLLIGTSLQEPFYPTPSSAAANSLALLVVATAFPVDAGTPTVAPSVLGLAKAIVAAIAAIVMLGSFSVILTKDSVGRYSSSLALPVSELGSARVVYSIIFLGSALATRAGKPGELLVLLVLWLVVAPVRPIERVARWARASSRLSKSGTAGVVRRLIAPSLIDIEFPSGRPAAGTALVTAAGSAIVLDVVSQGAGAWSLAATEGSLPTVGSEVTTSAERRGSDALPIGPIDVRSNGLEIILRVPSTEDRLRLGRLVTCPVLGEDCLFQVVDVEVASTSVGDDATYQYLAVTARKIGRWNSDERRFEVADWLPAPGSIARLLPAASVDETTGIGTLPETGIAVDVDPDLLVTHNCAVLGILGVGKSVLARQLTTRVLAAGIKVVVLDITGEWSGAFAGFVDPQQEDVVAEWMNAELRETQTVSARNRVLGGSERRFGELMDDIVQRFWSSASTLLVLNPEAFVVSRQVSFQDRDGNAEFARLSPADVTATISERLLGLVRELPLTDRARLLLVVEEAHALIPEWNSAVNKSDPEAVNTTARAVLQGRKYGMGVMIISQRTANVTKTVLNQCHTIVAMRSYDSTGIEFLSNYMGSSYSGLLPTLPDRQMVAFGRASSCPTPVVLQAHDDVGFRETVTLPLSDEISVAGPNDLLPAGEAG